MLTPLSAQDVRPRTPADSFAFTSTADLEPLREGIGQARATRAIRFGLSMRAEGYHIFVLGAPDTDRRPLVDTLLSASAATRETPADCCYVHDFDAPDKPAALRLPAGQGRRLRQDAERFVDELRSVIPAVFREDEFRARIGELAADFERSSKALLDDLRTRAEAEGLALLQTPGGFAFAPAQDGKVLDTQAYEALDEAERERLGAAVERFTAELVEGVQEMPIKQQELVRAQRDVAREFVTSAVQQLVRGLRRRWQASKEVIHWLDGIEADAIDRAQSILAMEQEADGPQPMGFATTRDAFYARYRVNLLVDHTDGGGAPVVFEGNPTLENLLGRIEHRTEFGNLVTDFTLLRPGALHRANGGYLIIEAERLLSRPFVWDALKRALFDRSVRPEHASELMGFGRVLSLDPEPVALSVKVVLIGQRRTYYLLSAYDPDFPQLFKVPADFEDRVARNADNIDRYARMLGTIARDEHLRPLDPGATAAIIDHSVRLVGDAGKLSAHTRRVGDLLREADQMASDADASIIGSQHVETAIRMNVERLDRIRSDVHERITQGTVLIATDGSAVGQVNGLSVLQIGELAFGQPSRITASARIGPGEVVDIEREAHLGGSIHTKAVMILSAFIGQRYARTRPLSLTGALVFEQSYGGVDGDSATVAEACALLSALTEIPLRQDVAVTGSMNQLGRVQAIGGANEKIEGFFDICDARGLTGTQGVLLPADNARHLMLRADVAEAIADGRFHVWTMTELDDALAHLSGLVAGSEDAAGQWTADSFNARIAARLGAFADRARELQRTDTGLHGGNGGPPAAPPGPPPGPEDQP
ncbi:MAG TPA: AAA family ATPase [Pseudomonadales bacterium]|nr:AAA family ATPase [Pseudomonadales bacterium]